MDRHLVDVSRLSSAGRAFGEDLIFKTGGGRFDARLTAVLVEKFFGRREIALGAGNLDEFNIEDQRFIRTDRPAGRSSRAIGKFRRNKKAVFVAFAHQLDAFGPAWNDLIERKERRS